MLKVKIEFKGPTNKDGGKLRFSLLCLIKHRWTNSSDKNHWQCWRCSRCNKIKYVLGNAGR